MNQEQLINEVYQDEDNGNITSCQAEKAINEILSEVSQNE